MQNENIKGILRQVQLGDLSPEDAFKRLKTGPQESGAKTDADAGTDADRSVDAESDVDADRRVDNTLAYASLDIERESRRGFPEVVYCEAKKIEHTVGIFERLAGQSDLVMGTRASLEHFEAIKKALPDAIYLEEARMIYLGKPRANSGVGTITVLCAGTSDYPVAEEAAWTAQLMGNQVERIYDVGVAGLHRLLGRLEDIRRAAVLIVVAGMEGALPSVVSGLTAGPTIAVPTSVGYGAAFGGLAALLGMLNSCSPGVTVVNIDNGFGAGYAASLINQGIQK